MSFFMRTRLSWSAYGIGLLLFLLLGGYVAWVSWLNGNDIAVPTPERPSVRHIERVGADAGRGNLLGIQPWMTPDDYRDGLRFREKLRAYLQTAQDSGLVIPRKTIVVLPEYLGTWLVVANEANRVYTARTVQDGLTAMVLSHPITFWQTYRTVADSVADKTRYAVFAMNARRMAEDYQLAFDMLAAEFAVTIVAGSILLPDPSVQNGRLTVGTGPLYNVSAVFHPDGRLDPQLVRKVYPITDERPFVCPANPADVPVFETPVGKLGVLVCADSWNSPVYQTLKRKRAALLAVPSFSAGDRVWQTSWKGYSGTPTPADARTDVGKLTEGQAWLAHAMAGRAQPEAGIKKGLNVFLRGNLWDLGSDGTTIILDDKPGPKTARAVNGATLTCLWLTIPNSGDTTRRRITAVWYGQYH